MTFVDRSGKLQITMSPKKSGGPLDLGNYTLDELKAKKPKQKIVNAIREWLVSVN